MSRFLALALSLAVAPTAASQSLSDYLPDDVAYDPAIPTPASVLGQEVGEWHVRPDQITRYFERLAAASPRMTLRSHGRTHENRELLFATFTSPENHARLEELRRRHVEAARGGDGDDGRPVVIWLGYSVHGNEPSGANASLLTAYHLAAATGDAIDALLRDAIVHVDPCLNPDGLARFAHWANTHKGKALVGDPSHREHRESWPGGRTNHYWFDLNRDWLLLVHPESRARVELFQRWLPNILTDHHEMGTNSTFFFQPGIPTRQNPNTPARNLELTRAIARYHADRLDAAGRLYYAEESFDDFYYGKGSTYPDVHGSIGILFEQASSRGHLQESREGPLDFPFTIENQFLVTLSTLEAGLEMKSTLLDYQAEFFRTAGAAARRDDVRAYVFGECDDRARLAGFVDYLRRHEIEVRELVRPVEIAGDTFAPGSSFAVLLSQPQYRLIKSMFERPVTFRDESFYDVSAWTLPLSYGIPDAAWTAGRFDETAVGEAVDSVEHRAVPPSHDPAPYAYLMRWNDHAAPRSLQTLLADGVRARVATRPFEARTSDGLVAFPYGTVVIPVARQTIDAGELAARVDAAAGDGVRFDVMSSGLTPGGIDAGSPNMPPLVEPKPMIVVDGRVSSYEAGELWHLLDVRYGVPVSLVESDRMAQIDLDRYTHVILSSGATSGLEEPAVERLRDWTRGGGVLVAIRGSCAPVARQILGRKEEGDAADDKEDDGDESPSHSYADYEQLRAKSRVAGAIFETRIDPTHPLGFGFARDTVAVFRDSTTVMQLDDDPFANVARYSEEPRLAGYASEENIAKIAGSAAVIANRLGRGVVVRLIDRPDFRGTWHGTSRFVANALFFGGVVKSTGALGSDEDGEEDGHGHGHGHDSDFGF